MFHYDIGRESVEMWKQWVVASVSACIVLCRLYITVGKAEEAVSMYKQLKMYGDMVRLVKQYFPEHLDATHLQLAKVSSISPAV